MNTDVIIIGAGASGLCAGVRAAELGIRAVVVEKRHRPGLKLLMCGNNRCNISHDVSPEQLAKRFGGKMEQFLTPAFHQFPPRAFMKWFQQNGLKLRVQKDNRVFPKSERADDVLHFFTDILQKKGIPLCLNSAVTGLFFRKGMFRVETSALSLEAPCVLICTGGVSYPKTGSTGDGQKLAKAFGHKIEPYRPGLAGFEFQEKWLARHDKATFPDALVSILDKSGKLVAESPGEIMCTRWGARGPSMVNASRVISRLGLREYRFYIDLFPNVSEEKLASRLADGVANGCQLRKALMNRFIAPELVDDFIVNVLKMKPKATFSGKEIPVKASAIAHELKSWQLTPTRVRPLKEAMVTVGGVSLGEIDSATMESRHQKNLFFAGEVMDVDGPTGGFNLTAAFATARLAVNSIYERISSKRS